MDLVLKKSLQILSWQLDPIRIEHLYQKLESFELPSYRPERLLARLRAQPNVLLTEDE